MAGKQQIRKAETHPLLGSGRHRHRHDEAVIQAEVRRLIQTLPAHGLVHHDTRSDSIEMTLAMARRLRRRPEPPGR